MALPQKVIAQLSREPPKTPGWSGQLMMFSSTIFFISLLIYLGLTFGYQPYLRSEADKLQDQIQAFSQQIPLEEQEKIIDFYSQLINLQTVLANHVFTSQTFEWMENNTQANVYYEKFDLNPTTNKLSLGGIAKTMEDVNQQFAIFANNPAIQRMSISNVTFSSGFWQFNVNLFFEPGYFQQ